jgi:hypothetical protein
MGLKISQSIKFENKKLPKNSGSRTDGYRLDELLDALTSAQAHGVPGEANVRIEYGSNHYNRVLVVEWCDER